jgi:hypothetical protein
VLGIGEIQATVEIYDSTNDTIIYGTTWTFANYTSGTFSSVLHGSATPTVYVNATLAKKHVYYVIAYVVLSAYASVSGSPKGTCSAKVDLASGTNSAKLSSFTRT